MPNELTKLSLEVEVDVFLRQVWIKNSNKPGSAVSYDIPTNTKNNMLNGIAEAVKDYVKEQLGND